MRDHLCHSGVDKYSSRTLTLCIPDWRLFVSPDTAATVNLHQIAIFCCVKVDICE